MMKNYEELESEAGVVGGCGRTPEELEFSATVVACCTIGYYVVIFGIAIIGELLA